jgi:Bacterial regulatory helix-turn-helix protein, lysR family
VGVELRALRWAVIAAQHKSLRQAAETLNIRQSTLSRGLRDLEHQLGAILFERTVAPDRRLQVRNSSTPHGGLSRKRKRLPLASRCARKALLIMSPDEDMSSSLFVNEHAGRFTVEPEHTTTPLATFATQAEAIAWAKSHHPEKPLHVARVRHLSDKRNPDHWHRVH